MITRFYLPLSTNVKHPKFGCHVTSLCQGLRRSAGSEGEDPENQVVGIQDQASAEVQVSMEAEVGLCHLLAKRRAGL